MLALLTLQLLTFIVVNAEVSPFDVYWNVPSSSCQQYDIFINMSQFGVLQNKDDNFHGDKVVILYDTGKFPLYFNTSDTSSAQNGGIPQLGDINIHLSALREIIELRFPDKNFEGMGVLDFESWRPTYSQNFPTGALGIYQRESIALEKRLHSSWPQDLINKEAERRFEQHARKFMQRSLQLAREMRPRASWGYYIYPLCHNSANNNSVDCLPTAKTDNDKLSWLFESSNALFPSIYLGSTNVEYHYEFVYYRLAEARRLAHKVDPEASVDKKSCSGKPSRPDVLPYVWYRYSNVDNYLTEEDLLISLGTPRVMGLRGAVVWGSSGDVSSRERCLRLRTYIENTFGPTVRYILNTPPAQIQLRIHGNKTFGDMVEDGMISEINVTDNDSTADTYASQVLRDMPSKTAGKQLVTSSVLLFFCFLYSVL